MTTHSNGQPRVIRATLVESRPTPQGELRDAPETNVFDEEMRIFRETWLSGGTPFAHLDVERLMEMDADEDDDEPSAFAKRTFLPTDEAERDDTRIPLDLEEAEAALEEALKDLDDVPWAPVPTAIARKYLKFNEDAVIDLVFPTVYDEDRTAKIKDLATTQALGYISHNRSATQAAKELGFDPYDYDEEMKQIRRELGDVPMPEQGVATGIGQNVVGLPKANSPLDQTANLPKPAILKPQPGGPGQGGERTGGASPDPKRDDISGDAQHNFRIQQRQAEVLESLGTLAMQTVDTLERLHRYREVNGATEKLEASIARATAVAERLEALASRLFAEGGRA